MKFYSGFITVVGRPNVGKSTLINCLAGEKIAITSPKPQTTRNNLRAIITDEAHQMIFIDTPGLHVPKNKLGEYMVQAAASSLSDVDAAVFVCDASDKTVARGDLEIMNRLRALKETPGFLALNKIDLIPKERLLERIRVLSAEMDFREIIPLSAVKGDGVEILRKALLEILPEGPKYFPGNIVTDSTVREISAEIIREKVLFFTNEEVPHGVGIEIIQFKEAGKSAGVCNIEANILCEKATHKGILIGKDGSMLKRIGSSARRDIEKLMGGRVNLRLWVKVKEDWRNHPGMLRELGFQ